MVNFKVLSVVPRVFVTACLFSKEVELVKASFPVQFVENAAKDKIIRCCVLLIFSWRKRNLRLSKSAIRTLPVTSLVAGFVTLETSMLTVSKIFVRYGFTLVMAASDRLSIAVLTFVTQFGVGKADQVEKRLRRFTI